MKIEKFKTYNEAIAYMKGLGDSFISDGPQLNCDDVGQWTYDVTVNELPYELVSELPQWRMITELLQQFANRDPRQFAIINRYYKAIVLAHYEEIYVSWTPATHRASATLRFRRKISGMK